MASMALRHGVFLAPYHSTGESATTWFQHDVEMCQFLDRFGFDEVWFGEHHSGGSEMIGSPELMIAAVAQVTSRLRLATGVLTLPYHNPLMVANRIAQLDHMTRGRAIFGVGPGLLTLDALMLGIDPKDTRGMMIEALEVILRLLRGETVTAKTSWFTLNEARAHILPFTQPLPEFAVASSFTPSGGMAAGTYGLSMLCVAAAQEGAFDVLGTNWKIANEVAAKNGHVMDVSKLRLVAPIHIAETREKARQNVRHGLEAWVDYYDLVAPMPYVRGRDLVDTMVESGRAVIGTPADAISMIERLRAKQGDFGVFLSQHVDWADWAETQKSYELYARYVMPHFSRADENRRSTHKLMQERAAELISIRKNSADAYISSYNAKRG